MPSPPLAVSMQTNSTPALTPALSPGRGRPFSPCWSRSPRGDLPKHRDCFSLSLGEREGVRASLRSNCIVTAELPAPARRTLPLLGILIWFLNRLLIFSAPWETALRHMPLGHVSQLNRTNCV